MSEFRLTQISDTHLSRADRFASLTENFERISAHIDAARPDLVVNSGDVSWDGPTNRSDLEFAKELHAALPIYCRYLPAITTSATTRPPTPSSQNGAATRSADDDAAERQVAGGDALREHHHVGSRPKRCVPNLSPVRPKPQTTSSATKRMSFAGTIR